MIRFLYHESFEKDIQDLERRFRTVREGLESFKRLCEVQFHPEAPRQVIAPAKLHRVTQQLSMTIWKIEMVVPHSGLRPNQWPRVWFAVRGTDVVFLCLGSHVDNYNDEQMNRLAISRVMNFF